MPYSIHTNTHTFYINASSARSFIPRFSFFNNIYNIHLPLTDLHALIEHFEDTHVVVVNHINSGSMIYSNINYTTNNNNHPQPQPGNFSNNSAGGGITVHFDQMYGVQSGGADYYGYGYQKHHYSYDGGLGYAGAASAATHGEDGVELEQRRGGGGEEEDGGGEDVLLGGVG